MIFDTERKIEITKRIGERIREVRLELGISQAELGMRLGYAESSTAQVVIARFEHGKGQGMDFYTLLCISKITGKSLYYFLGSEF